MKTYSNKDYLERPMAIPNIELANTNFKLKGGVANKVITFEIRDKSIWALPVMAVASNRADYYRDEFDGDLARSLNEDTLPLFVEAPSEILDWAYNNMDLEDVICYVFPYREAPTLNLQEELLSSWYEADTTTIITLDK